MAELVENPLKQTIPFDPRFPNQNQTRNCWQNYVDFHRCQKLKVMSGGFIFYFFKFILFWRQPKSLEGVEINVVVQGEEYEPCQFFYKNFRTVCPNAWIERWDEQREKGSFPANL